MDSLIKVGRIYKIKSPNIDKVYIGSTSKTLEDRFKNHYRSYNSWLKGTSGRITSFDIIKEGHAYIELVEEHEMITRKDLERKEGETMKKTDNCVNKNVAGRTDKEYYDENKDKICKKVYEYRLKNKDKVLERCKEYYDENKQKICKRMNEYYDENKQKICKRVNEYYKKNKDKIEAKRTQIYECECGGKVTVSHKARHLKSKGHKKWLENQE